MITYVNDVFVSNSSDATLGSVGANGNVNLNKGQFIVVNEKNEAVTAANAANQSRIKIGMGTGEMLVDPKTGLKTIKGVKWSPIVRTDDIKSFAVLTKGQGDVNTEDSITIDFANVDSELLAKFKEGGKRIIVRLTFKDLPTRFRKWTESYEYVTKVNDDEAAIASGIAALINKQWKRARVIASVGNIASGSFTENANGKAIKLVAMQYDDDNTVDSLNWAAKVRFNANVYYTDPSADGWESKNKHFPTGVKIEKVPGFWYAASGKLVRDREAQAMGYNGILNRGEGTWPIIKPAMNTDIDVDYNAITLEFENMYRAADDIFRKTKQAIEIYCNPASASQFTAVKNILKAVVGNSKQANVDEQTEDGQED